MNKLYGYIVLFFYSCLSSVLMLFFIGGIITVFYYFKTDDFHFPLNQVKRAIVFGCIAGAAITLAAIVFNLIDKCNSRKSPPSDSD